jgi:HSP20 family protein
MFPEERSTFMPSFEVKETKTGYVFKADVPGVSEKDLDIQLTGTRLSISGKRESEKQEQGESYYCFERSFGSFNRSFTLPEGVDADHVSASLKDGVLTLAVAKKPEVQPRTISVQPEKAKA